MKRTFEEKLRLYIEVVLKIGVNLQPGQKMELSAEVSDAPIVRQFVQAAYDAGAEYVDLGWKDRYSSHIRYKSAPEDSFDWVPVWVRQRDEELVGHGSALLQLYAPDADLFADVDPTRISRRQHAAGEAYAEINRRINNGAINWAVCSVASSTWADKLFPELPAAERIAALWDLIFTVCRVHEDDPVAAWQQHIIDLEARRDKLSGLRLAAVHIKSPHTDLNIGLADNHFWRGATQHTQLDIANVPNIPTEEVFTAPHARRVEGVVHATKPLVYSGQLIDDFWLRFEGGTVVEARAATGQAALDGLLATDDGARRLGELGVVPHSSPVSQAGRIFFNTLYDENAATHVALGRAYGETIDGGREMDDDAFLAAGGNVSNTHVDFMIGAGDVDMDGQTADGGTIPLMRNGEWV